MAFPMTDEELKKWIRNGTPPIKILAVLKQKEAPKDD